MPVSSRTTAKETVECGESAWRRRCTLTARHMAWRPSVCRPRRAAVLCVSLVPRLTTEVWINKAEDRTAVIG